MNEAEDTDGALVARVVAEDDRRAFAALVTRHQSAESGRLRTELSRHNQGNDNPSHRHHPEGAEARAGRNRARESGDDGLERGKKVWRVPVRGPITTNDPDLMRALAVAGSATGSPERAAELVASSRAVPPWAWARPRWGPS